MGYTDYLINLLRPLGVYDLESGCGAAEIYALGKALDGCSGEAGLIERECVVPTAETTGLSSYEKMLPVISTFAEAAERREAIMTLLQTDDTAYTEEKLRGILAGCGTGAFLRETGEWYTVAVSFPEIRGIPDGIEKLKRRIEAILPCHLQTEYSYNFPSWDDIEASYAVWDDFAGAEATINSLERYVP